MLTIGMMLLPPILAAFLHCKINTTLQRKNLLVSLLIYGLCINAIVLSGLWLIGMREFALFDMGIGFKIKYMLLGILLAVALPYTYKNLKSLNKNVAKEKIKRLLPVSLFWIATYAVFVPSSLFLGNIDEFRLNYTAVLPILLAVGAIIWCAINIGALCLVETKWLSHYIALVFSGVAGIYAQGNFLNPKFPALDGTEINWSQYGTYAIISVGFWILCIATMQLVVKVWKQKAEAVIKYASYFVAAVQLLSLIVLIITTDKTEITKHGFAAEGEFTVGTEENIIVFVVDSLESACMKEYMDSEEFDKEAFADFTFFDNAVSGGAPTELGMPALLTGAEYEPTWTDVKDYKKEVWQEVTIYDEMHSQDYDVRFYSELDFLKGFDKEIVDNMALVEGYKIRDYGKFVRNFYKLVNFYVMPQNVKKSFWLSTDDIRELIVPSDNIYRTDDVKFYEDFKRADGLQTDYSKAYRLYHLNGVHFPFKMDENIERIEDASGTEQRQMTGVMKIVQAYISALKAAGVYENSTIIITGDHGQHADYNLEANPAVLVKEANTKGEFTINSAPVHFRNLMATTAAAFQEDYSAYGPSMYDITDDSDVERLHTVYADIRNRAFPDEQHNEEKSYIRYIIGTDAADRDGYRIYNPYEINRFSYAIGNRINFTPDDPYAKNMTYRLYQENNTGIASNELSMCIELEGYTGGDAEFRFTYADIYNDSQKIKVYAKGRKVSEITCMAGGIGQEQAVVIPEECIEDGVLVLRMVFPNAVTPHQLDASNPDTRVLSVAFASMQIK